jgi:hypothetical protein
MSAATLSLAQERRSAELSSTQAEAIPTAIGRAIVEGAATKMDVQSLRSNLRQVEAKLETKIEQLRSNLMVWFVATNLTLAAVILAAMKL